MRRAVAALVLLIAACVTASAALPSAERAPVVGMTAAPCTAPSDSTRVRVSWDPVLDRRGDPVAHYLWDISANGASVATGQTTSLAVQQALVCPQYGDSLVILGAVRAVDTRGNPGLLGTGQLVVRTPDPGPIAPNVSVDTIASAITPADSISTHWLERGGQHVGTFAEGLAIDVLDTDTVTLCLVEWRRGVPAAALGVSWRTEGGSTVLGVVADRPNCSRFTFEAVPVGMLRSLRPMPRLAE